MTYKRKDVFNYSLWDRMEMWDDMDNGRYVDIYSFSPEDKPLSIPNKLDARIKQVRE